MLPVLYSFRRCPYAIRARYVLALLSVQVELREVVLKSKPEALLQLGGRSSVPQLVDCNGDRFEESLDVVFWAMRNTTQCDLVDYLWPLNDKTRFRIMSWVRYNDHFFKYWLDRYKYADRYPEASAEYYRNRAECFLQRLENRLRHKRFLMGEVVTLADIAIFPFIRQFAAVNQKWFENSNYLRVKAWLALFLTGDLFSLVMTKYSRWEPESELVYFPPLSNQPIDENALWAETA